MSDVRVRRATALLRAAGLADVAVRAVGFQHDVAAIQAPVASWAQLRNLSPQIRDLGFRYVALELAPPASPE